MGINEEICYYVKCDRCGGLGSGIPFLAFEEDVAEDAHNAGWTSGKDDSGGEIWHCPNCPEIPE
jgi:hypothetical protein